MHTCVHTCPYVRVCLDLQHALRRERRGDLKGFVIQLALAELLSAVIASRLRRLRLGKKLLT